LKSKILPGRFPEWIAAPLPYLQEGRSLLADNIFEVMDVRSGPD